jgi:hypothetical protein
VAALGATVFRCVRYALTSDLRTLPPLPGYPPRVGRALSRALIAWLHVVQPLARARGRLRGVFMSPEFELADEHSTRSPALHEIADALPVLGARQTALRFWSEAWLSREGLLTRIIGRVRSTRIATALEVDDGWHAGRDVSLQLGRWARLDVQLLVEEHERGRALVRVARRVRVTPFFAASLIAFVALALIALAPAGGGLMAAPVAVVTALMVRASWHAAATLALADQVITKVVLDAGGTPLGRLATDVAARIPALSRDTTEFVTLGPLERPRQVASAGSRSSLAPTARHAS